MKYNLVQRVFLVKKVYELKEISLVQRAFRREYPKDGTPNYSVIKNILSNFEKYGSVAHVPPKHKNLGQKREMAKKQLENMVSDFPKLSIRKAASALVFHPHLCITSLLTTCILNHTSFIYGISWKTKITKKG